MTTEVWKYPLRVTDHIDVPMPKDALPLFVAVQHGSPMLWCRVQPDAPMVVRRFRIAGTGHTLDDTVEHYVGSFMLAGGGLVFHVFEERAWSDR